MTVGELITELQHYSPDLPVEVSLSFTQAAIDGAEMGKLLPQKVGQKHKDMPPAF